MPDPEEAVPFILEAVRLVRDALAPEQALVGFCGGPFTVAGYLVEGKPTREFVGHEALHVRRARGLARALREADRDLDPRTCARRSRPAPTSSSSSTPGSARSSRDDYVEFVAPYSQRILDAVDVPTIHFGTGTAHLLETMAETGGDVIGLDWRVPLDEGWERVGHDRGVQGNLDPALLLGPFERVERDGARDPRRAPAAGRGTSSTSATACCRTRIRPT